MIEPPHSVEGEWAVISAMLSNPDSIPEVVGMQVQVDDFWSPDCRLIYEKAVECFYAGDHVDAVVVGELLRSPLSRQWRVEEGSVTSRLYEYVMGRQNGASAPEYARLVRRHADNRRLLALMAQAQAQIAEGELSSEEVGDMLATGATQIATGTKRRSEIAAMSSVRESYVRYLHRTRVAKERGIDVGAYFGLKFVDDWIKGLLPSELLILGGEPGVGKSAVVWKMAEGFARRQFLKDKPVAALILSMEMSLVGSSTRVTTSLTDIPGDRLREGDVTDDELKSVADAWRQNERLPLYWNFASNFKMSQMRALIVEAIRKHNVGFIVIDHFRMFDTDRRYHNPNQEDEAKVRFLKEDLAKDLNVAVICLAHTVKTPRDVDPRPRMADLRGSGQISAHADVVAMMYRPWVHASDNEKNEGVVKRTSAEMLYVKNRNSALGTADFYFDPSSMTVRDWW